MGCTVFANSEGFFHKGSGGEGKGFPDVCLSPPPPPAGPVPIPYLNKLSASDLTKGSKTVKIQGKETALEDSSHVSTSTGDEGGTQGGNVLTHKTKGTGYFLFWSMDVKVEGKGVDRHEDPMAQNCTSSQPVGAPDPRSKVKKLADDIFDTNPLCPRAYQRHKDRHSSPTDEQTASVQGKPCATLKGNPPKPCGIIEKAPTKMVADHQPSRVEIFYTGGCQSADEQRRRVRDLKGVKPQCQGCFRRDGGPYAALSKHINKLYRQAGIF